MRRAAGRPSLPLLFAITATGITGNTLITPSLPEILAGVDAPRELAGLLIAVATLPGILLAPVIGVLADRHGRREVLVPCLVLFGVAGGMCAAAPSLPVLLGLRFLQGAGSAGLINLAVVLIGDHWQGADRARAIGRNAAVLTTGIAVFPVLGGTLTEVGGWRAPFLVYPVALLTALLLHRRLAPGRRQAVTLRDQLAGVTPVLRTAPVWGTLGAGLVTFALVFGLLLTVLPLHLDQAFGAGPTLRGLLQAIAAGANTALALALGRLQRFRRRSLLATAALLQAAGLAALAAAPGIGAAAGGVALFGAGQGLMVPNLQDIATSAAPEAGRGTVVALFVSAARTGQTLGPVAAGLSLSAVGAPATFAAGALVAVVLAVPLVARRRVRST